jgi:WD40 repeat protein
MWATIGGLLLISAVGGYVWAVRESARRENERKLRVDAEEAMKYAIKHRERAEKVTQEKLEALHQATLARVQAEALAEENGLARKAAVEARVAAEEARLAAERLAAEALYNQAMAYMTTGEHRRGMLWLVRAIEALQKIPGGDSRLESHVRLALSAWQHSYQRPRMVFEGRGYGRYAALAPDGQSVAVYSRRDGLRIWHTTTGKPIGQPLDLGGDSAPIVAELEGYSPDGQWLAVARLGKQVRLFDAHGKLKHILEHSAEIGRSRFSPGSKQIATSAGREVLLWDLETGRQVGPPLAHDALVTALEFSPDGQRLATSTALRGDDTKVWDLSTGALLHTIPIRAMELAFIDGGRALVVRQGGLHVFRTATGAAIGKPVARSFQRMAATTTPGGKLATADGQGLIQLWTLTDDGLVPLGEPRHASGRVTALAFSTLGNLLVSAQGDQGVRLWVEDADTPHGPPLRGTGFVQLMELSGDTTLLTMGGNGIARIWDLAPRARAKSLAESPRIQNNYVPQAVFSADGRYLLTPHDPGEGRKAHARLWDVESGRPIGEPLQLSGIIRSLAFAADDQSVLVVGDKVVRTWDIRSGKMTAETPLDPLNPGYVATFTPDLRTLLVSRDQECRAWDMETGKSRWTASWRDGGWPAAISRDSRRFAVARFRDFRDIAIFDVETGAEYRSLFKNLPRGDALEFSPNGQLLAAAAHDQVHLWDINAGKPWGEPLRHLDRVVSLDWSPDGGRLLTSSDDRTARIWDVATGQSLRELQHAEQVHLAKFSPDGRIVVTMDHQSARLWDAETGQPLSEPLTSGGGYEGERVVFSPTGRWLFVAGKPAQLWPVPRPLDLEGRQLRDWAEWLTGMRLDADNVVRPLTAGEWLLRKQRVERAGIKNTD